MFSLKSQKVVWGVPFVAFFVAFLQGITFYVRKERIGETVCNPALALNLPLPTFMIIGISLLALGFFVWEWLKVEDVFSQCCWLIIIASGMSNLWERLFFGCVTDYIVFEALTVCNIADLFLTASVAALLWRWYDRTRSLQAE